MAEPILDLNPENPTPPDQSPEEPNTPPESELLKTPETPEQIAARLLRDGTPADKNIVISKEKYDGLRAVEEFTKTHAPLLDKVLKNPELLKKVLGEGEPKNSREEEISAFLEERKAQKRRELTEAVNEALAREKSGEWPGFEKDFAKIRKIADSLASDTSSYGEALRQGYIAVHPEMAQAEAEREAKRRMNQKGTFSSGGSNPPNVSKIADGGVATEVEDFIVKKYKYKDVEEYRQLAKKYEDYAKEHWNV